MKTMKQVQQYAKRVVPLIGLNSWDIYFRPEHLPEDGDSNVGAQCYPDFQYKMASIAIYDSFWKVDTYVQQEMIVHELCHIHLSFYDLGVRTIKDDPTFSQPKYATILNNIRFCEEETAVRLSRALTPLVNKNSASSRVTPFSKIKATITLKTSKKTRSSDDIEVEFTPKKKK